MRLMTAVVILLPLLASATFAADVPPTAESPALSPVAAKYAKKHEALAHRFAAKRKAMTEGAAFKSLSPEAQKAKLDALDADFKARDARIAGDESAERSRRRNIEQAKAQQQQSAQMDQFRTQAAQDMRDQRQ